MKTERSKRAAVAVVGVLSGALLVLFAPIHAVQDEDPESIEVLRAQRIELVDERGQIRAQLQVEPDGEAILRIRDPEGNIRIKLGASQSGSGLVLLNDRTEPGVQVVAGADRATITLEERGKGERVIAP
jgi:hypothetical protein